MALQNRIDSLKKQHEKLDRMIHEEEIRPGSDDSLLHKLKAQKLALKDEIERLVQGDRVAA